MYLNRQAITEYPFHCTFYEIKVTENEEGDLLGDSNNGDLLDEEVSETSEVEETRTVLLEKRCDIQRASELMSNGTIMADYEVFCPCEIGEKFPFDIRYNTKFECNDYAIPISGRVIGFEYSQLGGFHVRIKMSEV